MRFPDRAEDPLLENLKRKRNHHQTHADKCTRQRRGLDYGQHHEPAQQGPADAAL
jgi:hypothetical protein